MMKMEIGKESEKNKYDHKTDVFREFGIIKILIYSVLNNRSGRPHLIK